MKKIILCFYVLLIACNTDFNKKEAFEEVVLRKEDFVTYKALTELISTDYLKIRKEALLLTSAIDTTYLETNSYYLYQIRKPLYEPIIETLKNNNIYEDKILISSNRTFIFLLKSATNNNTVPSFMISHTLIYNYKMGIELPFSSHIEVLKDSIIDEDWKYICYKVQVGH